MAALTAKIVKILPLIVGGYFICQNALGMALGEGTEEVRAQECLEELKMAQEDYLLCLKMGNSQRYCVEESPGILQSSCLVEGPEGSSHGHDGPWWEQVGEVLAPEEEGFFLGQW